METLEFFARRDPTSLGHLEDIFLPKEGYLWFIEDLRTNKWLTEEDTWTKDALLAKKFITEIQALKYQISAGLSNNCQPTEHKFLDNK